MPLQKSVLYSILNKNLNNHQVIVDDDDSSPSEANGTPITINLNQLVENSELKWFKTKVNLIEAYAEIRKKLGKSTAQLIDMLKHNLNVIDTLSNGDIIKLEGTKLFDTIVIYHHAAIISSILIY